MFDLRLLCLLARRSVWSSSCCPRKRWISLREVLEQAVYVMIRRRSLKVRSHRQTENLNSVGYMRFKSGHQVVAERG